MRSGSVDAIVMPLNCCFIYLPCTYCKAGIITWGVRSGRHSQKDKYPPALPAYERRTSQTMRSSIVSGAYHSLELEEFCSKKMERQKLHWLERVLPEGSLVVARSVAIPVLPETRHPVLQSFSVCLGKARQEECELNCLSLLCRTQVLFRSIQYLLQCSWGHVNHV